MRALIRPATVSDLEPINEIYNYYVEHSTCTYQETPEAIESRHLWFDRHGVDHPVLVAELNGLVVGWGALSPFHARSAYRFTVENSVYVGRAYQRQGIGDAILTDLVARARLIGHRTIVAAIDADQAASVAIHTKHGFETVGHLRDVGYKFDRWLGVIYMQLLLC